MKKILIYIIGIACIASTSSCDKWLEATSATQIQANELLESRSGFQDALSGVYITMASETTYGAGLTWKYSDMTAYPYVKMHRPDELEWQKHNYNTTSAKNILTGMWKGNYNSIANINFILRELPKQKSKFTEYEYNLFKGELMGLRAFLHFDILKKYGVAQWNEENDNKLTIPYVTTYSPDVTNQKTYKETREMLKSDLDSALIYLAKDPVRGDVPKNFDVKENEEGFWNHREKHFNYYAAKMLKARICQWENGFEKQAELAEEIIKEAQDEKKFVKWIDAEEQRIITDVSLRDWTFSCEHIFSLEVTNLTLISSSYIMNSLLTDGLRIPSEFIEMTLFPPTDEYGTASGAEDLRGPAWQLNYTSAGYECFKLYQPVGYAEQYRSRVPIMKLAELYYMIAENQIEKGENEAAIETLNKVRANRGISDPLPSDADPVYELSKEYYREFTCEGQIFNIMKHSNLKYQLYPESELSAKDLIYPYPQDEKDYGRNQEL